MNLTEYTASALASTMRTPPLLVNVATDVAALLSHLESHFPWRVWLVGGTARMQYMHSHSVPIAGLDPKDVDVVVEGASRGALLLALTGHALLTNTFGGHKVSDLTKVLDVFSVPSVSAYLTECPKARQGIALNLSNGCFIITDEFARNPSGEDRVQRLANTATGGVS